MAARAESWASEQKGRTADQWYDRIADIKEGEFESKSTPKLYQLSDGRQVMAMPDVEITNGFYSPIEKRLAEFKQEKASVNKWKQIIGKGDEATFTGVRGWLDRMKPDQTLSKAEITQFMKDNRIEVVEVVKSDYGGKALEWAAPRPGGTSDITVYDGVGGNNLSILDRGNGNIDIVDRDGNVVYDQDHASVAAAMEFADKNAQQFAGETKFSDYQLAGEKSDYKEVLVTIPQRDGKTTEVMYDDFGLVTTDPAFAPNAVEVQGKFKSSHFDEANIVVHLRMNTRTDSEGNKVLFLEEVQSDWGQKGKKEGFKEQGKKLRAVLQRGSQDRWSVFGENNELIRPNVFGNTAEEAIDVVRRNEPFHNVPTAPFVTDTNAWTKLGLKIALKEAVRQGADKIAWTTGEQQNARYDLSKQVDEIGYVLNKDGTYLIVGKKLTTTIFEERSINENKLEDYVGKEIAKKIINGEGQTRGSIAQSDEFKIDGRQRAGYIKGNDLKVGGKGMIGFYGSPTEGRLGIIGGVVEKLAGQKVGTVEIDTGKGKPLEVKQHDGNENISDIGGYEYIEIGDWIVELSDGSRYTVTKDDAPTKTDAINEFKRQASEVGTVIPSPKGIQTQHSIDVTPQLKAGVEKGQPLFQKQQEEAKGAVETLADGRKVIHALTRPDFSTMVHELGHIFEADLTQAEIAVLEKWSGMKRGSVPYREKFARAFERYLRDGKAPTQQLKGIFDKFKEWMTSIYKSLKGTPIEQKLTPKVRQIFDRLLTEQKQTKVEQTQARVEETKSALKDAFDKWKNQGVAYDPRSQAEADVALTKALVNHLVAVGANTVAKIQAAVKEAIGLDVSKKDAQYLLEASQSDQTTQEGKDTTKGEKVPEKRAKDATKRSGFEERSVRARGEKDDVGKVVRDIVEADPTFYNVMNREEAKADAVSFIEEAGGFDAAYAKVVTPSRQLFNAKGENVAAQRQVIRQVLLQYYGEGLAESIRSNDREAMLAAEEKITPLTDILAKEATAGGQMSSMLFWKRLPGEATVHMIDKTISEGNTKKLGFEAQEAQQVADAIRKEMQQEVNRLTGENESLRQEIDKLIAKYKYGEGKSGTTKVPQTKAKEIATKIRSLKTSNLGITLADPTGIVAIMDGALEATARVVETTGNILHAINEGLAVIRNSKAFKELSKNKQSEVVNKYKESIREQTGLEVSEETLKTDSDFRDAVFDVIRNHYLTPNADKRGLANSLMEDIGLTKREAEAISKVAFDHFKEHTNKVFEKVLNPKDSENRKKVLKTKRNKFIELVNEGVLFDDNFSQLFGEKFGLPKGLTADQRAEIHKLATNATQLAPYGIFGDIATKQLADYVRSIMPKEGWGKRATETIIGLRYASMLSGPTTHFVNLFSSMINPPLHAIGRAVDAGAWIRALAYLYRGDRKGFAANNPLVDLVYSPLVARKQIGVAWNKLMNTIKDGDIREASKWVEGYKGRGQLESLIKTPILERVTFGGRWSSVKYKGRLVNIHPANLAKYVGRALLAEDQFLYSLSFDVESAIFTRLRLIEEQGLTGKALRDAVIREIQGDFLDASKTKRVEQRLQDAVNKARDAGIEVTSTRLQSLRTDFIRQENGMNPEQSAAAEQAARRTNFTEQRGGIFSAIADGLNRFSNYNIWTKLISMPFFPFTTILGRLGDMALDTMYGGVRAHGFSPTGIIARYRQSRETGNKADFWVHPADMGMFKSAALGDVGSRRYQQQMAAQYFGLTLFAFAAPTFMRINEDDKEEAQFFDVWGGLNYDSIEKRQQHPYGAHTVKIGPLRIRYSSKPIISGIFSLLGNYKDALRAGVDVRDGDLMDKVKLSMLSMSSSWTTVTETTAASGAKDFITLVSTVAGEAIGEDAFSTRKVDEGGIDWTFSPKVSREIVKLGRNYADVVGSVSPMKANFIQQIWRGVSPEGRLRGTPGQVFMHNIGLQNLTNDIRTDIFGQPVKTMPGDANIAWPRETDWRWKIMWDGNVDITDVRPWVEVKIKGEWRTMEHDEFMRRKELSNNLFRDRFDGYLKDIAEEGEDYKNSKELKKRSELTEVREVRSRRYKESKLHQDLQGLWSDVDANVMRYLFLWDEFVPDYPKETEWLKDNLQMPMWKDKLYLEPYEEQMSLRVEQAFNNARMDNFLKAISPMIKSGELDSLFDVVIDPRTGQTAAADLLSEIWKDMEGYGMEAAYREYREEQEEEKKSIR